MIKAYTCTWNVRLLFPGPFSPERSTRLALASTQYKERNKSLQRVYMVWIK
jgi:hypothetical protein